MRSRDSVYEWLGVLMAFDVRVFLAVDAFSQKNVARSLLSRGCCLSLTPNKFLIPNAKHLESDSRATVIRPACSESNQNICITPG